MNMWRTAFIVARRDFVSIVMTPTFLLFLLAPLFMLGFAMIGGGSARMLAANAGAAERIIAIVPAEEVAAFRAVDGRMKAVTRSPLLTVLPLDEVHRPSLRRLSGDANLRAVLTGPAASPQVYERGAESWEGRYLATLAETVAREGAGPAARMDSASAPRFAPLGAASGSSRAGQSGLGYGAVFGLFMLTLLLGGQTVGMLAEEKGNKVIEIMAAAVPLEGVFLGKLFGMLGVALLFILFWASLVGGLLLVAGSGAPPGWAAALSVAPAVGWPAYLALVVLYFLSAFLLLGAVFLGVGAQAGTVREIQMLSLPITLFQVGMFALASAAANLPGSMVATVAQWLPWSSPFAMAASAATDARLWPHALAIAWQAGWIALTVGVGVRLFRAGVLKAGGGWQWPWSRG